MWRRYSRCRFRCSSTDTARFDSPMPASSQASISQHASETPSCSASVSPRAPGTSDLGVQTKFTKVLDEAAFVIRFNSCHAAPAPVAAGQTAAQQHSQKVSLLVTVCACSSMPRRRPRSHSTREMTSSSTTFVVRARQRNHTRRAVVLHGAPATR